MHVGRGFVRARRVPIDAGLVRTLMRLRVTCHHAVRRARALARSSDTVNDHGRNDSEADQPQEAAQSAVGPSGHATIEYCIWGGTVAGR